GRYLLMKVIGEGGMGEVWKAWDRSLSRWVALKLLKEGAANAKLIERLRREAEAAAKLRHPNIVAVHDVGSVRTAAGAASHFIAMDYVQGRTLAEAMDGMKRR